MEPAATPRAPAPHGVPNLQALDDPAAQLQSVLQTLATLMFRPKGSCAGEPFCAAVAAYASQPQVRGPYTRRAHVVLRQAPRAARLLLAPRERPRAALLWPFGEHVADADAGRPFACPQQGCLPASRLPAVHHTCPPARQPCITPARRPACPASHPPAGPPARPQHAALLQHAVSAVLGCPAAHALTELKRADLDPDLAEALLKVRSRIGMQGGGSS